MEVQSPFRVSSALASACTTPATAALLEEIKRIEQIELDYDKMMKELEEEISTLEMRKEAMIKKLEDNKVEMAQKAKEFKIKKRELDEVKIKLAATKGMLRKRKGINYTAMRLEMVEEITEIYDDEQKDILEMLDIGPFASSKTVGNILEEIEEEAETKLETLRDLLQEKLEYEEMEKENKIMRSELETLEEDLPEIEETTGKLRQEAGELMKTLMVNREQTEFKVPKLRQEMRELQVKLSTLLQTGKPRSQFYNKFTVKRDNQPLLQPPTPASNFYFKKK